MLHVKYFFVERNIGEFNQSTSAIWINAIIEQGRFGVPLFFAISGFILARPFARQWLLGEKPVSLKHYFFRRLTRIEPPYIINMLVFYVLVAVVKHQVAQLLPHLLASLFYLHNLIYWDLSPVNAVAWSLEIEVQFYVLAPLLALIFCVRSTRLRRSILAAAMVGFGFLRYSLPGEYTHGFTLLHQMQYFLAGFALTDMYLLDWKHPSRKRGIWDFLAVLGWAAMLTVLVDGFAIHLVVPWLILLVYSAAFRGHYWPIIVRSKMVYLIGGMCYSIYLWHPLIVSSLGRITTKIHVGHSYIINLLLQESILVPLSICSSAILFLLFEKPFMKRNWPKRWYSAIRSVMFPSDSLNALPNLGTNVRGQ